MLFKNADFEAKLKRQYILETSESQDANVESRKFEGRSEIKAALNDAEYTQVTSYIQDIQSQIVEIHTSQADTLVLKSDDMSKLAELNFHSDLLNEILVEIVQERKAFFDNVMDNSTVSNKTELCEIIVKSSGYGFDDVRLARALQFLNAPLEDSYGFDDVRLARALQFLNAPLEDSYISRLDEAKAKINSVVAGNDEELITFLEEMFAKNNAPYYGRNSLKALEIKTQNVVGRISNELAELDKAQSIDLFNTTLARIITADLLNTIRKKCEIPQDIDWKLVGLEILNDVVTRIELLTKANRATLASQRQELVIEESVVIAPEQVAAVSSLAESFATVMPQQNVQQSTTSSVVYTQLPPAPDAVNEGAVSSNSNESSSVGNNLGAALREQVYGDKQPEAVVASGEEGKIEKPTDTLRNRVCQSGKRPPSRKSLQERKDEKEKRASEVANQNNDDDNNQEQAVAQIAATQSSSRRRQVVSMYVDPKAMQKMLAAGAAAATTLRGNGSNRIAGQSQNTPSL